MTKAKVNSFDLIKQLSEGLRERADAVGIRGYVPMATQKEFHDCTTQGRLFSGGNRAGKTVGGCAESVMWLTGEHPIHSKAFPPPVRGRICAVDFDRGVEMVIVPQLKTWLDPKFLINGKWSDSYHKATRVLTLNNGSTCELMSYDQDTDKFAGTSRHFVHFDEEPPKAIFSECLARLIDTNGKWWMTMTPLIDFSWTAEDLYEPIKDGKIPFITLFESPTADNTHIEADAIEKLTFLMDDDERDARTTGSGYNESTLIFPELKNNIIAPLEMEQGRFKDMIGWEYFTTFDHGLRNPTAILFMAVGPNDQIVVFDEYYETEKLVRQSAQDYLYKLKSLRIEVKYMVGDPSTQNRDKTNGVSVRQEYGEHGVWYMLGNNDVKAGLLRVKSAFEDGRLKITENCVNTIREARTYKWKKPISAKVQSRTALLEEPVKRNDHAMDALRYGIMSLPETEKEIDTRLRVNMAGLFGVSTTSSVWDKPIKQNNQQGYIDEHLGLLD
jgi:phage terminase large subunit-like protein